MNKTHLEIGGHESVLMVLLTASPRSKTVGCDGNQSDESMVPGSRTVMNFPSFLMRNSPCSNPPDSQTVFSWKFLITDLE